MAAPARHSYDRSVHIHEPRLHHVVGAVLCSASWFTLMMLVAIDVAGFQTPKGDTVDWLFGVPAAFRVAGWSLLLWRDFPDLQSARSAAATLGGNYFPRRLEPLQQEVRSAR